MSTKPLIVIVGQDAARREALRRRVEEAGFRADEAEPSAPFRGTGVDAVLLDVDGEESPARWVEAARAVAPLVPIVVVASARLDGSALMALGRARAYDVVVVGDDVGPAKASRGAGRTTTILRARLEAAVAHGRSRAAPHDVGRALLGSSPRMEQARRYLRQAARASSNVLLLGETGTGKELAARAIHEASARAAGPFVAVNCAAFTETLLESELFGHERGSFTGAERLRRGAFEVAGGGTLLLDEVGDMPPAFQAKLLRVLQPRLGERATLRELWRVGGEAPVHADVRVIAATNVDLAAEARARRFREDLLERLAVLTVQLPPLRERRGDLHELVQAFLERQAAEDGRTPHDVDPAALEVMSSYPYPKNVRELEGTLRAIVSAKEAGDTIVLGDLPPKFFESRPPGAAERAAEASSLLTLAEVERAHVERTLRTTAGNKARAAELLGISRPRLDRLLAAHRIEVPRRGDVRPRGSG